MPLLHPATGGGYTLAPMGACPDENVLVQLAHGGVESPSMRATLQAHLDGCATCRQLVAAVAGGSAPLAVRETFAVLSAGATLGRYRVERLIGSGGMGVLYEAHDTRLERRVALKLMHPSHDDDAGKARLWREAQAMARLSHQNVVNVFDLGEYEGQLFLAMELVSGGTLRKWLQSPRSVAETVKTLCDAGEGLAAAHKAGVVHRDFKPENVLIGEDGRARVTDFGLARPGEPRAEAVPALATGPIDITRTGTMMGTPAYMSPEQLLRQPADARSDQYSFCVTLYEALYGKRPHDGGTLDQVRAQVLKGTVVRPQKSDVPERVWNVLSRGLSVEPAHRFSSMDELLAGLRVKEQRRVWPFLAAGIAVVTLLVGLARAELQAPAVVPTPATAPAAVVASPTAAEEKSGQRIDSPIRVVEAGPPEESPVTGGSLVVSQGESASLSIPGLQRLAVGDAAIADVKATGKNGDVVRIFGGEPGKTTLLAWTKEGKRSSWLVTVRPKPAAAKVEVPEAVELTMHKGEQKVLKYLGMLRVAVGETDVADVKTIGNHELLVTARGAGRTNVLVWTSGGARHEVKLTVLAQ